MAVPLAANVAMAALANRNQSTQGAPGQAASNTSYLNAWSESDRLDKTVIRGPPPKESVSMVMYIVIAVVIISILIIYFGLGRKWQEPPKYQSVFDSFTPDRMVFPERKPTYDLGTDSTREFGIIPLKPIKRQ